MKKKLYPITVSAMLLLLFTGCKSEAELLQIMDKNLDFNDYLSEN